MFRNTIFSVYSHRSNTSYWATLDQDGWTDEIGGMKAMITEYAGIPAEEIKGKYPNHGNFLSKILLFLCCLTLYTYK